MSNKNSFQCVERGILQKIKRIAFVELDLNLYWYWFISPTEILHYLIWLKSMVEGTVLVVPNATTPTRSVVADRILLFSRALAA